VKRNRPSGFFDWDEEKGGEGELSKINIQEEPKRTTKGRTGSHRCKRLPFGGRKGGGGGEGRKGGLTPRGKRSSKR